MHHVAAAIVALVLATTDCTAMALSAQSPPPSASASAAARSLPLLGKKALVTGSSGGIGRSIAVRLAHEGASVLVHYHTRLEGARETKRMIEEDVGSAGRCDGIVGCDFRSPAAIDRLFRDVVDVQWGGEINILVNNAGVVTKLAAEDDDASMSSWHETMAVNLHAPLQLSRLAYARMKRRSAGKKKGGGVIVNNTSIHGSRSVEYMTAYAASKAALDSLTRGLALEFAAEGVRVNAVAPGVVPVERTADAFADPAVQSMWEPHLPVGRAGTVGEIADAALFLCTNEWATGTVLQVDGGMMARANMPIRPRPPAVFTEGDGGTTPNEDVSGRNDVSSEVIFEGNR